MRYYTVHTEAGTVRLPSVTTILDVTMPLEQRYKLEQAKVINPARSLQTMNAARARGEYIHRYVSTRLQNGHMGHGLYGKWLKRLDPWIKAVNAHNNGVIWADQVVTDCDRGYAGTFDLLLDLPGYEGKTLVDLKTTGYKAWPAAIHSAQLQAAAYAAALNKHQWIFQARRIATLHISPYSLVLEVAEGDDLSALIDEFYVRLSQFGSRLCEAMTGVEGG